MNRRVTLYNSTTFLLFSFLLKLSWQTCFLLLLFATRIIIKGSGIFAEKMKKIIKW